MLASRFRVLCADAGLSIEAVAQTLHVTTRTVRYWFSGKTGVPYAAYRLVRVMRWFELPQKGFEGWCMHSGKLWTPEGIPIGPQDGGWWSLLVRQARCFRTLYQRSADFERSLMMLTAKGLTASDGEPSWARPEGSRSAVGHPDAQRRVGGGAAAAPNLLIEHFSTVRTESTNSGLGVAHG